MAKLIKKFNPLQLVSRLLATIQATDNIIDIFAEANKLLRQMVRCDHINIFLNNEKARYFYINHILNSTHVDHNEEIIIPYSETTLTEMLQAQRPVIRHDLSGRGKLTPGDLKFLAEGIKSDLSVPIINKNKVLAVINLSSHQSHFFSKTHQLFTEQIASLLGLALERAQLIERSSQKGDELQLWENRFHSLMNNVSEAIATIRVDYDIIYDTNRTFQKLTGFSAQELHGMRLSALHPQSQDLILSKLQQDTTNGKHSDFVELSLRRKDGASIPVTLRFVSNDANHKNSVLAIYKSPEVRPSSIPEKSQRPDLSREFIQQSLDVANEHELEKLIDHFMESLCTKFETKFISLQLAKPLGKSGSVLWIRQFPGNLNCQDTKLWRALFETGPFQQIQETNQSLIIADISQEDRFSPCLSLAQKLGFHALISVPINCNKKPGGVLSLFFEDSQQFDDEKISSILSLSRFFSILIENNRLFHQLKAHQLQLSVFSDIQSVINLDFDIRKMMKQVLVAIHKISKFDYAQISLFDEAGENVHYFTAISDRCRQFDPQVKWMRFENCDLYWNDGKHKNLRQAFRDQEADSSKIEKEIRSSVPVPLTAQNKYLGMLVIGSLESNFYPPHLCKFFEEVAPQIALVIDYSRQCREHCTGLTDFSKQVDLLSLIGNSLDVDAVLERIAQVTADEMQAQLVSVRLVEDGNPFAEVTFSRSDLVQDSILNFEKNCILPKILIKNESYVIDHLKAAAVTGKMSGQNDSDDVLTCLSAPIKLDENILAVLTVYWNKLKDVQTKELSFLKSVTIQAGFAIQNAKLYRAVVTHFDQAKIKSMELEKIVACAADALSTPIISIQGLVSDLLNAYLKELSKDGYNCLESIQRHSVKLNSILNDLQEFFQVRQAGYSFEEINFRDIIKQATAGLMHKIKCHEIELIIEDVMPVIYCDRNRMVRAFSRIIDHAITILVGDSDNPKIEIGQRAMTGENQIFIRFNGKRIRDENQKQIFDLFHCIHQDDYGSENGIGIGLVIAKKIIERHDGEIWLESEEEKGSIFYVTLPKNQLQKSIL